MDQLDQRLNLDDEAVRDLVHQHLPLGVPVTDNKDQRLCQLSQEDYISGYSKPAYMPLWSAFKSQVPQAYIMYVLDTSVINARDQNILNFRTYTFTLCLSEPNLGLQLDCSITNSCLTL